MTTNAEPGSDRRRQHIAVSSVDAGGTAGSACRAPSVELHFSTDGSVRPCCIWGSTLGTVGEQSITDLWTGHQRAELVRSLDRQEFPSGCGGCAAEVAIEGRDGSYPSIFDDRGDATVGGGPEWPTWMEFNLSNACNLQCVQCDGELSSAIRTHRERRRPMERAYGASFFEEIRPFLPHLEVAQFAGGEPFLAPENYRMWDLIASEAPNTLCIVITNGTQYGPKVERAMESVRMGFTLSIDGASRETFEAIRVGADFDRVMTNTRRFLEHTERAGTPFSVNHCLMPQNHHEFGDLLLWAEELGVPVSVSVVRGPGYCTIAALEPDEIRRIHQRLLDDTDRVRPHLRINAGVWDREVARIGQWAQCPREEMLDIWSTSRYAEVLGLSGKGSGPHDDTEARRWLESVGGDTLHWIDVGSDDMIREVSSGSPGVLGLELSTLAGAHIDTFREAIEQRLGRIERYDVLTSGADRIDARAECRSAVAHLSIVALRDAHGRASVARLLVTFDADAPMP